MSNQFLVKIENKHTGCRLTRTDANPNEARHELYTILSSYHVYNHHVHWALHLTVDRNDPCTCAKIWVNEYSTHITQSVARLYFGGIETLPRDRIEP
jgi:hypothetical protein